MSDTKAFNQQGLIYDESERCNLRFPVEVWRRKKMWVSLCCQIMLGPGGAVIMCIPRSDTRRFRLLYLWWREEVAEHIDTSPPPSPRTMSHQSTYMCKKNMACAPKILLRCWFLKYAAPSVWNNIQKELKLSDLITMGELKSILKDREQESIGWCDSSYNPSFKGGVGKFEKPARDR